MASMLKNNVKKKIKKILKGALKFKRINSSFYSQKILNDLNNLSFPIKKSFISNNLTQQNIKDLEVCIKQKFLNNSNSFYTEFFYSYSSSNKKLNIPLPNTWYKYLIGQKFKINYLKSRILF